MEAKISKPAIKEILERYDILNKSHPLKRYNANSGKNKKKSLMHFDPDARVFILSNWNKIQLLWQIFFSNLLCLTPFSQLQLGLIDCVISIKEYVSLPSGSEFMAFLKNYELMMINGGTTRYNNFLDKIFWVSFLTKETQK